MKEIRDKLERGVAVRLEQESRRARSGLWGYLSVVKIDSRPEPRPYHEVSRPWQRARDIRIVPALEAAAWSRPYDGPRAFCEIMPRGHDKTTGLARYVNGLLLASPRPLEVVAAAADRDQAGLLLAAMKRERELNPFLSPLDVQRGRVAGPGGSLTVLTADAPSSFGQRVDVFLVDELTWWKKRDLFDALWSGWQKMPGAVFCIISNAGVRQSWQWDLINLIRDDPDWCFYEAPGHLDTWMAEKDRAQVRRLLPPSLARRVLDNVWIDPGEESGYLTREEVAACEQLGRDRALVRRTYGQKDTWYLASIDYGPKRDRTVLAVGHQAPDGVIEVDRLDVWQGSPEEPIPIARVRDWLEEQRKAFGNLDLVIDPYQMLEVVQHYQNHMAVTTWEARGGKSNYEMAEALRTAIVNRRLAWYPGCGLLPLAGRQETLADELAGLVLKVTSYGYRFDHEAAHHDDRAVTLGMLVVTLLGDRAPAPWVAPEPLDAPRPEQYKVRQHHGRDLWGVDPRGDKR